MDYYGLLFLYYLKGLSGKSVLKLFFNIEVGGTEQLLPENTSTPTTTPILADIQYPDGLRTDQYFTYRETPTTISNKARIKTIKGQTLKWNQLLNVGTLTAQQGVVQNLNLSDNFNFVANHKYLLSWNQTVTMTSNTRNTPAYYDGTNHYGTGNTNNNLEKGIYTWIFTPTNTTSQGRIWLWVHTPNIDVPYTDIMLFDLTLLGIDSLTDAEILQWFADYFPLSYYSFNSGSLIPFNGNGIKTVGKNQLNLGDSKSATVNGVTASYDASTQKVTLSGTNTKTDSAYILINFTPSAIPKFKIGETYVVSASSQIPTNTYFNLVYKDTNNALQGLPLTQIETRRAWRFTVPSNYSTFNSFQIGILKEARQLNGEFGIQLEFGSTATEYEPYTSHTTNLPVSTYFPTGMKSAGNVYDELTPSKATTRIGAVTFNGSENWYFVSNNALFRCAVTNAVITNAATQYNVYTKNNRFDDKSWATRSEGSLGIYYGESFIFIKSTQFADASALKTWLQSNPLTVYYVLATPEETVISPELDLSFKAYYNGTEQLTPTDESLTSPIIADITYLSVDAMLQDILDQLGNIQGTIEQELQSLDDRVSDVEADITTIEGNVSSNTGRITTLETGLANTNGQMQNLNTSLVNTQTQLTALDDFVSDIANTPNPGYMSSTNSIGIHTATLNITLTAGQSAWADVPLPTNIMAGFTPLFVVGAATGDGSVCLFKIPSTYNQNNIYRVGVKNTSNSSVTTQVSIDILCIKSR